MIDALGRPQSVLLLGATSDIGQAICQGWSDSIRRIVLAGRPSAQRARIGDEWRARGARVSEVDFDALDFPTHPDIISRAFAAGDVDVVIIAFGTLGSQASFEGDPVSAAEAAAVNYAGAVSCGLAAASALQAQGHGTLVVLSSVAGLRPRRSNFVYGSTKAGLDSFATGLADRLHGTGCHVLIVRPGFVRTSMTAGLAEAPLAVSADEVADAVVAGVRRGRRVVYVPATIRPVMAALRALPRPVFRRLNL